MTELVEFGDDLKVYTQSVLETQYIYDEIFQKGCYDATYLPERPLIVDVGANIGMFVLFMKRERPGAEFVCFEPMPDSIEIFRKNMDLHCLDGITLHETALGSREEENVAFSFFPMLPANSTRYPKTKELAKEQMAEKVDQSLVDHIYHAESIHLPVKRLAEFLPEDRSVDLLKIDAEGAEADVLLGVDANQWQRIRRAIVEVLDIDDQLEKVCDILSAGGFEVTAEQAPLTERENRYYMVHALRR